MLCLEHAGFCYTNGKIAKEVFSSISFCINEGEIVSVVGRNGCGKTTLLRVLAGFLELTSGRMTMGYGKKSKKLSIGWVPQFPVLMPNKTIKQNIILPIECAGQKVGDKFVAKMIDKYGLREYIDFFPHQVSGGTKQKASIVRALITSPQLLLMDEPFFSIDAYTREIMNVDLAKSLRSEKVTTILVTHSLEEAVFLSDRVFVMSSFSSSLPSTIIKEVEINLSSRRGFQVKSDPSFVKIVDEVRRYLYGNTL